ASPGWGCGHGPSGHETVAVVLSCHIALPTLEPSLREYSHFVAVSGARQSCRRRGPGRSMSRCPHEQIVKTPKRSSSLVEAWLPVACASVNASRHTIPPEAK